MIYSLVINKVKNSKSGPAQTVPAGPPEPPLAAVVGIISRHGLTIEACCKNQPNKNRLVLYKPLLSC